MIPRRIVQIWGGGGEPPLLGRAAATNLRLLNPGYEYRLFDDAGMRAYLDRNFPEYRATFESFPRPIQRYDFFRYLAIYGLGGFYFDFDVLLAESLDGLLGQRCVFPFERLTWTDYLRRRHAMDWEIGNYAFGAVPGHPFLLATIRNCARAQREPAWRDAVTRSLPRLLRDDLAVIYATGPGMASRTLAEYVQDDPVTVLFPPDVRDRGTWGRFGDHGVHLGAGQWRAHGGAWRRRLVAALGRRNESRALARARAAGPTRSVQALRRVPSTQAAEFGTPIDGPLGAAHRQRH
ncbi:MAG: glycosyltransferase [Steroidobacteraceae bacterium]|nr:glycosyltransferase [Steroidobacteraceae bacterium]